MTTALAAGTLSAISFAAAPTAAMADNIVLISGTLATLRDAQPTFRRHWSVRTSIVRSCRRRLSRAYRSEPQPAQWATWTIILSHSGCLTVTDVEYPGYQFELFDNGIAMTPAASPFGPAPQNPGQAAVGNATSVPGCISCETGVNDINFALGDS